LEGISSLSAPSRTPTTTSKRAAEQVLEVEIRPETTLSTETT